MAELRCASANAGFAQSSCKAALITTASPPRSNLCSEWVRLLLCKLLGLPQQKQVVCRDPVTGDALLTGVVECVVLWPANSTMESTKCSSCQLSVQRPQRTCNGRSHGAKGSNLTGATGPGSTRDQVPMSYRSRSTHPALGDSVGTRAAVGRPKLRRVLEPGETIMVGAVASLTGEPCACRRLTFFWNML